MFWLAAGLFIIPLVACVIFGGVAAFSQPQLLGGLPLVSSRVSGTIYGEVAAQREAGNDVVAPVVGATVNCGGASVVTDSHGHYAIAQAGVGTVTCAVTAASYATTTVSVRAGIANDYALDFGTARSINGGGACTLVVNGEHCGALELRPGSISGVVLDSSTHQPVNSAQVTCWDDSLAARVSAQDPARYVVVADEHGAYTIPGAPVGLYRCVAGENAAPQPVLVPLGGAATLDFSICPSSCPGVSFHGGRVQHTLTLYIVYWTPPGVRLANDLSDAQAHKLIERFVNDLGGTAFYGMLSQYWDDTGPVRNVVKLGGTFVDTSPYPATGNIAHPLIDSDVMNEIVLDEASQHWALNKPGAAVALFLGAGVQECSSLVGSYSCSFAQGNDPGFCAYHSYNAAEYNTNGTYAYPYMLITGAPGCDSLETGGPAPYGASFTDEEINSLAHEIFESMSDPDDDGWYGQDASDSEIADLCAQNYGPMASDGSTVQLAHGHGYAVQRIWSLDAGACAYS